MAESGPMNRELVDLDWTEWLVAEVKAEDKSWMSDLTMLKLSSEEFACSSLLLQ